MRFFSPLLCLILISFNVYSVERQYQIVLLKNGKVISGTLVREEEHAIYLRSVEGAVMTFKKDTLDLDRMKVLNSAQAPSQIPQSQKSETITLDQPVSPLSHLYSTRNESVVELATKTKASRTGKATTFTNQDVPKSELFGVDPVVDPKIKRGLEEEIVAIEKEILYWKERESGEHLSRKDQIHILELKEKLDFKKLRLEYITTPQEELEDNRSYTWKRTRLSSIHSIQRSIIITEDTIYRLKQEGRDPKLIEEQEQRLLEYRQSLEEELKR